MSAKDDRDALLAFLEGRSDAPPDDLDPALLESDDPALAAAFADVARQLTVPDPDDGVLDVAWASVEARLAPDAQIITPPARVRRRWGMAVGAVLALAAGLLVFALRPPTAPEQPVDPHVKGAASVAVDVDFLREDGRAFPTVATQSDRLVPRARLSEAGHLTLAHVGPTGATEVLPFSAGRLPPGMHAPTVDGAPMAYSFDGEPGAHRFVVFATRAAPSADTVKRWIKSGPPEHVAARRFDCEVR